MSDGRDEEPLRDRVSEISPEIFFNSPEKFDLAIKDLHLSRYEEAMAWAKYMKMDNRPIVIKRMKLLYKKDQLKKEREARRNGKNWWEL